MIPGFADWAPQSQAPDDIALGDFRSRLFGRPCGPDTSIYQVGKKRAGALLDGRKHREMPA